MLAERFTAGADFGRPTAEVKRTRGANGAHVKFANGWVVSVQWGPYTYLSNHDYLGPDYPYPEMEALTAEIAAWKGDGEMIRWPNGDTVQGWQSWAEVQAVLDLAERDELESAASREQRAVGKGPE